MLELVPLLERSNDESRDISTHAYRHGSDTHARQCEDSALEPARMCRWDNKRANHRSDYAENY